MYSSWIVKTGENNLVSFYHTGNNAICVRKYEQNRWQQQVTLVSDVRKNFTVCSAGGEGIILICQNNDGGILICDNTEGHWQSEAIMNPQNARNVQDTLFFCAASGTFNTFIYSVPGIEDRTQYIAVQSRNPGGNWSNAVRVDRFSQLNDALFKYQQINLDHGIVFYLTKGTENTLGYKEVTSNKAGDFTRIHTTSYQFTETSFLTSNSCIHMVYAVKSIFASQLIYRAKHDSGFTNPYVIWEGQRIGACLIFSVRSLLYIAFQAGGVMYICSSDDNGVTFSRPQKYKGALAQSVEKAAFVSSDAFSESNCVLRELFVDAFNPWMPQMLPEMYPDFYPLAGKTFSENLAAGKKTGAAPVIPKTETKTILSNAATSQPDRREAFAVPKKDTGDEKTEYEHYNPDDDFFGRTFLKDGTVVPNEQLRQDGSNEVDILKYRLSAALEDNADKVRQILKISSNFNVQAEEYAMKEVEYRKKIRELDEELSLLRSKIGRGENLSFAGSETRSVGIDSEAHNETQDDGRKSDFDAVD